MTRERITGLVSTIIPVRNRQAMLIEAVESVLSQTYRPIEIIISDDGSNDGTREASESIAARHPDEIRYVWNEPKGPGPAREVGRERARGEFVQYLDSDDLLLSLKFETQVRALREDVAADVAYGITRLVDDEGRVLREPFKWTGQEISTLFPLLLVDRWWCTHTALYRSSVTDAVGPWMDLRYSQDWEYDARIGALGARLAWCPVLVSSHRVHSGSRQTGSGRWLVPKDRVRFFESLHRSACQAGVPRSAPEMRHFVRWVFAQSRQSGIAGDSDSSRRLFALARNAADAMPFDMAAYRVFAAVAGWRTAAVLTERVRGMVRRAPGRMTLKQSWMESDAAS